MVIDWTAFDSKFVKIDDNYKRLVMGLPTQGVKPAEGNKPAVAFLNFPVLQEDGKQLSMPKVLEVTTKDLVDKLKPFVEQAIVDNKAFIEVEVCRIVKGKYGVRKPQ